LDFAAPDETFDYLGQNDAVTIDLRFDIMTGRAAPPPRRCRSRCGRERFRHDGGTRMATSSVWSAAPVSGQLTVVDVDHGEASFGGRSGRRRFWMSLSIDAAGYWSTRSITAMRMSRSSWKRLSDGYSHGHVGGWNVAGHHDTIVGADVTPARCPINLGHYADSGASATDG